jgi:hypothetical protein
METAVNVHFRTTQGSNSCVRYGLAAPSGVGSDCIDAPLRERNGQGVAARRATRLAGTVIESGL